MSAAIDRDPLACRVRWHAEGCVVVTSLDGSVHHEAPTDRQPQGEAVRLFTPAPNQLDGQLSM